MQSTGPLKVLITSAAGRVGKELVAHLLKANKDIFIRACCRSDRGGFLKALGAHEVIKMDYMDPSTFEGVLDGVNVVFSSSPDPCLKGHKQFMELVASRKDQIKHIVRLSCFGAEQNTASYEMDTHVSQKGAEIPLMMKGYWWGEEACINTGIPTTVLRANFFMGHLLKTEMENIMSKGFFRCPLGETRNSFVSTNDVGEAASVTIQEGAERHGNKFYDITGPTPQNMHEVAADLAAVLEKPVEYKAQDLDEFEKDFGKIRREFFEYLNNGFYTRVSPSFYNLTGHKPTSWREHLTKKGAAGETGVEDLHMAGVWKKGVDIMKDAEH